MSAVHVYLFLVISITDFWTGCSGNTTGSVTVTMEDLKMWTNNSGDVNFTSISPVMEDELFSSQPHHGVHVANWRWDEIGLFFAFSLFIVTAGLAKVAFHHVHFLTTHIPESCLMIIVGITVGGFIYLSGVPVPSNEDNRVVPQLHVREFAILTFTPRLFFLVLLPPVILESAYSLYDQAFACNCCTIVLNAVVGTVFNIFTIGTLLYGLFLLGAMGPIQLNPTPGAPAYELAFTECLVFSSLISAVDPVAVLAIFQEVGVNKDLYYLLFGESLLNDAVTVVLYTTMVTFTEMKVIPTNQYLLATLGFFTVSLGGFCVGVAFGLLTALLTKATQECRVVEPLAVLGMSYLSYLTAELFHFSGIISIIFCGLVQAHYTFKNISTKSYITVKYFCKMVSSTCDAIIFLFLGMVLVSDRHVWHTGFVLWTLVLCLVCRFIGVHLLTGLANMYRVRPINLQEQFLMSYGGIRGAVAFSLVEMLETDTIPPRQVFVTTTLVVIIFTVFVQGGTIKPLVDLLDIAKSQKGEKKLNEEISENVISTIMAGIEEISGVRGDYYIRRKIEQIDNCYLKKVFLKEGSENNLTRRFEKLSLTDHYAHLYGPVFLIEDKKTEILRSSEKPYKQPEKKKLAVPTSSLPLRTQSFKTALRLPARFGGSEKRNSSTSHHDLDNDLQASTETLRQAFRSNPYKKFHERYNPNLIDDDCQELSDQLEMRHRRSMRITQVAAVSLSDPDHNDQHHSSVKRRFKPVSDVDCNEAGEMAIIYALMERAHNRLSVPENTIGYDSLTSSLKTLNTEKESVTRRSSVRDPQLHNIVESENDMSSAAKSCYSSTDSIV